MKRKSFIFLLVSASTVFSCSEKSDPAFEQANFVSIIDNKIFSTGIYPIDIKQTSDGGYLILAERTIPESNFRGTYILKTDKYGKFVRETILDDHFVNPVGPILSSGSSMSFVCMDALTLQAYVVTDLENSETPTMAPIASITYPAAVGTDGNSTNSFVLLSYDQEEKNTIISRHSLTGAQMGNSLAFNIGAGEDVEEPIINHFLRTGRRFPFQVGQSGGLYYFTGFYNYTFSLVFTNLSPNGTIGVVQGQQDDGGISAVYPLGESKFAAARFNFGNNFFLPNINLNTSGTSSSTDLGGNSFPELISNAPVKIISKVIGGSKTLIFGSDTKSKQIGLFFYNESSGEFLSSKYLGFSNPFEIAAIASAADDGLIVVGTTYLAGRFPRICLLKISKTELEKQL